MTKDRIKIIRKSKKYTQKELAKILNCAPSKVAMWETGDRTPRTNDLVKLSEIFNVSVDSLVGIEEIDIARIESFELEQDETISVFAKRLRSLRVSDNKHQKELALMLDVSPRAYGYYEQGEREPDLTSILKLADYFNVSTDYLLGKTDIKIVEQNDEKDLAVAINGVLNRKDLVLEGVGVTNFEINRIKSIFSNLLELTRKM